VTTQPLLIFVMAIGVTACGGGPTGPSSHSQRCKVVPSEFTGAGTANLGNAAYSGCSTTPPFDDGACRSPAASLTTCGATLCPC
jgi:hypothetical protein